MLERLNKLIAQAGLASRRGAEELILKGASADEIEIRAKEEGMMTMLEDGLFMAVQGITSTEEVLRVVSE